MLVESSALLYFFPSSRDRDITIGSWKTWEGCRSLAVVFLPVFSARFQTSLDPFFFFLPLLVSLREAEFSFFHISRYFLTSLIRFSPSTVFSYVSYFSSVFFFFAFSATHFSFPPSSRILVPSRPEIGLETGVDIGSICDLPRATITCNTVGLSGPMGTRWGVFFVRKKDITVAHSRVRRRTLTKSTICRPCLIMVDMSDDLSGLSLQLDVCMSCLSCERRIYIIET